MRLTTGARRLLLILLGAGVVVGVSVAVWQVWIDPPPSLDTTALPEIPLPPYSDTKFQNTGADAHFIGSVACAGCHPTNHKSYLLTPHSRALSDVDPAVEPPDASFHHPASNRTYRVYRRDGQYRHEEVVKDEKGREVARVDLPVKYLIGSGHFCRTYLVEANGFLAESPITWYSTKRKWDLSPGYDAPQHAGFERQVLLRCLACHAGRVEAGGTTQTFRLHEKAIGCESCHGPGSLHQDLYRTRKLAPGEEDRTIVNPGKLPRPLQEAVCAACHLGSPASVHLRGRQVTDIRPGRPLTDYRIDYRAELPAEQMTVTGHIDQLRMSGCYKKSDMTCLTCHNPHRKEEPKDKVAFYRQLCVDCHTQQPCKVDVAERVKKQPGDNCVACHMPKGDTDIPHLAFTHHRIGKHTGAAAAKVPAGAPKLIAAVDDSWLSPADRERNHGLAYLEAREKPDFQRYEEEYLVLARGHLEKAYAAGLRDAETLAGLADCNVTRDRPQAMTYARATLVASDLTPEVRARALTVLAYGEVSERNTKLAVAPLEELVRLRRLGNDWRVLAWCYLQTGEGQKAKAALDQSFAIRPYQPSTHLTAAEIYERLGDSRRAAEYRDKARWLAEHRQD